MTGHDRQQIETRLDARLQELTRMRDAVGPVAGSDHPDVVNHPAELAGDLHDREIDAGTRLLWQEEEMRISEARRALANGTYGSCQACGQQIAAARLAAVPEAVRCVDCQRHFEGAHRQRARLL
jgi:RNA polymerase-binding transcription factor DksA